MNRADLMLLAAHHVETRPQLYEFRRVVIPACHDDEACLLGRIGLFAGLPFGTPVGEVATLLTFSLDRDNGLSRQRYSEPEQLFYVHLDELTKTPDWRHRENAPVAAYGLRAYAHRHLDGPPVEGPRPKVARLYHHRANQPETYVPFQLSSTFTGFNVDGVGEEVPESFLARAREQIRAGIDAAFTSPFSSRRIIYGRSTHDPREYFDSNYPGGVLRNDVYYETVQE